MDRLHAAAAVFRSHPDHESPAATVEALKGLLRRQDLRLLPEEGP